MRTRLWLYRLFLAKERAGLEAEHTKTLEKIYALTKGGLGLGLKTSVDLMEARSALTESRMALIKARGVIAAERLTLNRLIGFPPDRRTAPEKDLNMPFFGKVPSLPELIEGLDNRRLDIRALGLGYKSEEARLRAAVLSQFPAINIGALSARDTDGIKTAGGLFAMNIPIFNRNQGAIAVERATRKKLFDEYRTRIFEARADIARLLNNLSSLSARLEKIDKSERELQIHLNAYKHAVEKGVFDGLDYYGLQARLQEKKSEVLTLEEQGMEQAISLEIASGRYIFTDGSRQREKIKKSEEAGR
jgi:outer membrane protein TolC